MSGHRNLKKFRCSGVIPNCRYAPVISQRIGIIDCLKVRTSLIRFAIRFCPGRERRSSSLHLSSVPTRRSRLEVRVSVKKNMIRKLVLNISDADELLGLI